MHLVIDSLLIVKFTITQVLLQIFLDDKQKEPID